MANETNTVTYTGVTNDLYRRVHEHKKKFVKSFTAKYNITKLVYFEAGEGIDACISREKQIKSRSRADKVKLIGEMNPDWHDLYRDLVEG